VLDVGCGFLERARARARVSGKGVASVLEILRDKREMGNLMGGFGLVWAPDSPGCQSGKGGGSPGLSLRVKSRKGAILK